MGCWWWVGELVVEGSAVGLVVEGGAMGLELRLESSVIEAAPDPDPTRQLMMSSWLRAAQWDSSSAVLWWWVYRFAGFVGLLVCGFAMMVVCGWLSVDCGGGFALCNGFLKFFFLFSFFFILRCSKHCKIFFRLFSKMQSNIGKTIIFPEIICIFKHFTVENILRRNKRNLKSSHVVT